VLVLCEVKRGEHATVVTLPHMKPGFTAAEAAFLWSSQHSTKIKLPTETREQIVR
jgi:hypothetical protein